jgi:pseudouridine-5'-phosphate glycosidase
MINTNPDYYTNGRYHLTDVILDWDLNFLQANIVKYVKRHNIKGGEEDLLKAAWYLNKLLEMNYGTTLEANLESIRDSKKKED